MQKNGKPIEIRFEAFPEDLRGKIYGLSKDTGRSYLILIDSTQDTQTQRRAIGHELAHVFLNHHGQTGRPVKELEKEADEMAAHFYREYEAEIISN